MFLVAKGQGLSVLQFEATQVSGDLWSVVV
jgi:hypothetical protein